MDCDVTYCIWNTNMQSITVRSFEKCLSGFLDNLASKKRILHQRENTLKGASLKGASD